MQTCGSSFGKNLEKARKIRGWTQGQLEEYAKVDQSTISKLKTTGRDPDFPIACKLAQALGVSLDWLAGLPARTPGELLPDEQELLRLYRNELEDGSRDVLLDMAHTMARRRRRELAPPGEEELSQSAARTLDDDQ